jgi:PTH1 family peptidyl-tRNA hydrolase
MVADLLAERAGGRFKVHKSRAEVVEGRIGGFSGPRVVLAKPMTFMNNSGAPVSVLRDFFKIPPTNIVVIHDELDIPFGTLRLKCGGGDNGHNGLRSITRLLGTRDYLRVRFGIGRPPGRQDPADYVLKDFSPPERKELPFLIDRAADAAEAVLGGSLADAQNVYHAS